MCVAPDEHLYCWLYYYCCLLLLLVSSSSSSSSHRLHFRILYTKIRFSLYLRCFQIKIQFQHFHSLKSWAHKLKTNEKWHHPNKYLYFRNGRTPPPLQRSSWDDSKCWEPEATAENRFFLLSHSEKSVLPHIVNAMKPSVANMCVYFVSSVFFSCFNVHIKLENSYFGAAVTQFQRVKMLLPMAKKNVD